MPDDDYKVGYRKPPRDTQFKRGTSGNPGGRPRRSNDIGALIDRNLDRLVTVIREGRKVRITMREHLVTSTLIAAAKGDHRARELAFRHMRESGKPEPFRAKPSDDEILAELAATLVPPDDDELEEG